MSESAPLSRAELEALYAAQCEAERRHREAPLLGYRAMLAQHPKQAHFHALGVTKRRRLFCGGNRSGKTTAGDYEGLAHAIGYRWWEIPTPPLDDRGGLLPRDSVHPKYWVRRIDGVPVRVPNIGMMLSGLPRLRGIGEVLWPKLWEALPLAWRRPGACQVLRGAQGVPDYIVLPNGSKILFATAEQDDSTFEGFVLDWCYVDEPVRQSIYGAVWARLTDYLGSIWFTQTPLGTTSAWLYNAFVAATPPDVGVVEVSMADNPFNTAEKVKQFVEQGEFPERELAARLHGRFEHLGNRVFDTFDPTVHIIKGFRPPSHWVHGLTCDPHHKRPPFLLWWAFDPVTRTYHFHREFPPQDFFRLKTGSLAPAELAGVIRNAEGADPVLVRICDPRFGKAEHVRHGLRETPWVEQMAEFGLHFEANFPYVGNLDHGHKAVESLLRYDKNFPVSPTNRPRLLVHDGLANLSKAFLYYGYIEDKNALKEPFRKVSEEYKDPLDCVRYTILFPLPLTDDEVDRLQTVSSDTLQAENEVLR